jgi:hypothetical protein
MFLSGRVSEENGFGAAGRFMIFVAAFSLGYAWGLDGLRLGFGQFLHVCSHVGTLRSEGRNRSWYRKLRSEGRNRSW